MCVWLLNALFPSGLPYAAVLNCVECPFEVNGCSPQWHQPATQRLSEKDRTDGSVVGWCQFGGGSLFGFMAFLYSSSKCCLALLVECLITCALTHLVSAALPLLSWLMALLSSCIVNGVFWC